MKRLFVAVALDDPASKALETKVDSLKKEMEAKWVSQDNYHITLAFLGDVEQEQPVIEALKKVTFSPFEISIESLAGFHRLLYAKVEECPALNELCEQVRFQLETAGIDFDHKAFRPHITLARKCSRIPAGSLSNPIEMRVGHFALYQSEFIDHKRIYTPLALFS